MSARNDGGPAFPVADFDAQTFAPLGTLENVRRLLSGMSLRDYFAAKAMSAQVATDMVPGEAADALIERAAKAGQDPVYRLALNSYEIADAMLKARTA